MENMYLLVEDNCNMENDVMAHMDYVYFGTEEEVREEMERRYKADVTSYDWDHHDTNDHGAYLWDDVDDCGYDRHISWSMIDCGPKPEEGGLYLLTKGIAHDGGGVDVLLYGAHTDERRAKRDMLTSFGLELTNPSFYAGWDPEYCELDGDHALATVETMDMVVKFDVIQVIRWDGGVIHEIDRSFGYIG